MPTVTVIIPSYNHARYLRRRIDSVLGQTYRDFDVLLMDDCSNDNSREIIEEYRGDARVRIVLNDVNSGSTFKQWNKGVGLAGGQYLWLAESDDYSEPTLLQRLVEPLDRHPNVGIACCLSHVVDEHDRVLGTSHDDCQTFPAPGCWREDFIMPGREVCGRLMPRGNVIPNASAAVFRRELYLQAGGADESMRLCGDWKLWTAMLLRSDLAWIGEPLNHFRTHAHNVRTATRGWLELSEQLQVFKCLIDAGAVDPATLEQKRKVVADYWISHWLYSNLPDPQLKLRAMGATRAIDPHFNRRVIRRAMQRSVRTLWTGRTLKWFRHLLRGAKLRGSKGSK